MKAFTFLFVVLALVTKLNAWGDLGDRAKLIPPELAEVYFKEGNPKILCIEAHKMSPLVDGKSGETKMVVAKITQETDFGLVKIYRLDGKLVAKDEAQRLLRQPTKVIISDHQFDKTNEYYSCFDKQMLVISRDLKYPGDVTVIPEEAQGK